MVKQLTRENFQKEAISASEGKAVLVDFWAPWCGPCRMQGPIVEEMAEAGFMVGKVNIDEESDLASQYRVMSIPTLIIFKNGKEAGRMVGVQSRQALEAAMA